MANILDRWSDEMPWLGQYTLNEDGNPVIPQGLLEWGEWYEAHDRHVADDQIGNARVSTIFLGLDHGAAYLVRTGGFDPLTYKPVLWETMVFGGPYDLRQMRYTSREDALEGHKRIVQMLTS